MKTPFFGEIEVPDDKVITMVDKGIIGFKERMFALIEVPEILPFLYLQSLDNERVGFLVVNPWAIEPNYAFEIDEKTAELIGVKRLEDVAVFCIVTVEAGGAGMTVNLRAPILVGTKSRRGMQVILDDERWPIRAPIAAPGRVEGNARADKENRTEHPDR